MPPQKQSQRRPPRRSAEKLRRFWGLDFRKPNGNAHVGRRGETERERPRGNGGEGKPNGNAHVGRRGETEREPPRGNGGAKRRPPENRFRGVPGGPGNQRKSRWQLDRFRNLFLCGTFCGTLQNSILIPTKQESDPESSRAAAAGRPKSPESRTPP